MYVWLYVFLGCTRACVSGCDGDVICVGYDLNRCSGWWYVCSVNVEKCWLKDVTLWNASFKLTLSGCVVSKCYVGFASLNVVCDELNDCAWIVFCSSFLISVCMLIVSKALLISNATVIVRTGWAIWLNPFATVLFTVCSAVTVECRVCTRVAWVCLVCLQLCKEEGTSPMSLQLLRGGIWAYMGCPCLCRVLGLRLC